MSTDIFSLKLGVTSSYLIRGVSGIVMVDTGTPNKIRVFRRKLAKLFIRPGDIKLIVLTHSHVDHSGSSKDIKDFTGGRIAVHQSEQSYLEKGDFIRPGGVNNWGKITRKIIFPFLERIPWEKPRADILVNDEMSLREFGIDGKIIHTPGHTHGSISILLETGEAFVGCLAHAGFPFRMGAGFPIYAQDIEQLKLSWKKLIDMGARVIFPGHGNPFPVEIIKRKLMHPDE